MQGWVIVGKIILHEPSGCLRKCPKQESYRPNSVTYSVLIHGLCEAGRFEETFQFKQEIVERGCQPSTRTYSVLVKATCDISTTDKAINMLDEMAGHRGICI